MKRHFLFAILLLVGLPALHSVALGQAPPQETRQATLVRGLDGGEYEAYAPAVIERVQQALQSRGLYSEQVNGLLDQTTMEAISQFQRQNGLQVCGVPTPQTRRLLLQAATTPAPTSQQP